MKTFFENDEALKKAFGIKRGQLPLTKFVDNLDAIQVEMINWPDPERAERHLVAFATSSWFEDFYSTASKEDVEASVAELLSGRILPQGWEGIMFSFRISGMSLHGSHALVRTRIGASYLQQSQAVKDLRHEDILVPRAFQKDQIGLEEYIKWVIAGKQTFVRLIETGDISITDARFCLPKTIPVWINASFNLASLLGIYSKRTDTQEEHPEMNLVAEKMRQCVVEKFPYMDAYFKRDNNCIHRYPGYRSNCVFKRDENHQLKSQVGESIPKPEDNWTLHDKTKEELMLKDLSSFQPIYYLGSCRIEKSEYDDFVKQYEIVKR